MKGLVAALLRALPRAGRYLRAGEVPDGVVLHATGAGGGQMEAQGPFAVHLEGGELWVEPGEVAVGRANPEASWSVPEHSGNISAWRGVPGWSGGGATTNPVAVLSGVSFVYLTVTSEIFRNQTISVPAPAVSAVPVVGYGLSLPARTMPGIPAAPHTYHIPLAVVFGGRVYQMTLGPLYAGFVGVFPFVRPLRPFPS